MQERAAKERMNLTIAIKRSESTAPEQQQKDPMALLEANLFASTTNTTTAAYKRKKKRREFVYGEVQVEGYTIACGPVVSSPVTAERVAAVAALQVWPEQVDVVRQRLAEKLAGGGGRDEDDEHELKMEIEDVMECMIENCSS